MGRSGEVRVTRSVKWVWADVEAKSVGTLTELRHLDGGARLTVWDGRLIRGPGYARARRDIRQQLARVGAIVRLRERGKYFVHASGVVDPAGRAWILTGDTGAGKSTLAFALSRAGWRVLGDDGVIVQRSASSMVAHPWRDPLRVSLGLAPRYRMLDEIAEVPLPYDERRRVPVHAPTARSAPIAGVLLLEQSPEHRLARVSASTALPALVRQSPWVMLGDSAAAAHYDALQALVHTVPVFHLAHGASDLDTIATTIGRAA